MKRIRDTLRVLRDELDATGRRNRDPGMRPDCTMYVLLDLENHHNFAWKEEHVIDGVEREVIVHRKGATPAGAGVLGIISGSMATPGFVVSGKGNENR
jgi:RNA-splicing ligase RtcB